VILSAKILTNVASVNQWNYCQEAQLFEGQANEFYLQLVDLSKNIDIGSAIGEISDHPIRYIPQGTRVSLKASFSSVDDTEEFEINATQPFSDDGSIWKIQIPSTQLPKSGNFQITLTEDGISKTVNLKSAISVNLLNISSC